MYELEFRNTTRTAAVAAAASAANSVPSTSNGSPPPPAFTVARIAEAVNLAVRLADREKLPPAELDRALAARSDAHHYSSQSLEGDQERSKGSDGYRFVPRYPLDRLFPGTYYLEGVSAGFTRSYARRPMDSPRARGGALVHPPSSCPNDNPTVAAVGADGMSYSNGRTEPLDSIKTTRTTMKAAAVAGKRNSEEHLGGKSFSLATAAADAENGDEVGGVGGGGGVNGSGDVRGSGGTAVSSSMSTVAASVSSGRDGEDEAMMVSPMNGSVKLLQQASVSVVPADSAACVGGAGAGAAVMCAAARFGALLPRVVVTGVACGLPGQANVFEEDNLGRLLGGQGCVEKLSEGSMAALVEKNVVQVCTNCLLLFVSLIYIRYVVCRDITVCVDGMVYFTTIIIPLYGWRSSARIMASG